MPVQDRAVSPVVSAYSRARNLPVCDAGYRCNLLRCPLCDDGAATFTTLRAHCR